MEFEVTAQGSIETLVKTAKTTLGSKGINKRHDMMANIAVDAIMAVPDYETKTVKVIKAGQPLRALTPSSRSASPSVPSRPQTLTWS